MDKVAIILPVYNVITYLPSMIEALYKSTNFPFKLIIVDGFSTDGTEKYIDNLFHEKDNVEYYQIKRKGLVNAINYGIKKAGKMDIYLTQADVIHFNLFGRDWLQDMYDQACKKNVGIVVGIMGGGISGKDFIDGFQWAGTWNTYLPKRTLKKVGLFDESFGPGDDIDYSYRVELAGLKGIICNFWVQHHRLTEHGDSDDGKKIKRMGKLFKKKWGIK